MRKAQQPRRKPPPGNMQTVNGTVADAGSGMLGFTDEWWMRPGMRVDAKDPHKMPCSRADHPCAELCVHSCAQLCRRGLRLGDGDRRTKQGVEQGSQRFGRGDQKAQHKRQATALVGCCAIEFGAADGGTA